MHKQVSGWTVNFGPNSPVYPFLELKTRIPPPHFQKLQIWDDQSLLRNTPPISGNFRFGMTKVYSEIPPHFGKLQIWDDQSLLRNTPPFRETSDLGWPKFTPEYPPPILENFRFGMTKVYSRIPPPPISENFRFGMTKVYSRIPPPHFGKLQIWDDQSLLRNTPPFRKIQIWDDQSLLRNTPPPNENCQRVQVRDFQNTESYYMWRLYPTRITTSCYILFQCWYWMILPS